MNLNDLCCVDPNEQPLDHIPADGGYCGIFRTIACVGDSLSSGEFVATNPDGTNLYLDMFDYSWGQYMARTIGSKVYNFSRGGMTASEYCESFAAQNDFWNPDKSAEAYIIALGVNDLFGANQPVGSTADICPDHPEQNQKTFAGYYARIIQNYRAIRPDAKFFLVTIPDWYDHRPACIEQAKAQAALLHSLAAYFPNTYVIDLWKYAPATGDRFHKRFMLSGHMTPTGYILMSRLITGYIDYIIRHHMEDFRQVGFIGTPYRNTVDT